MADNGFGAFGRDFARSWNGQPAPAPAPAPVGPQVKFVNVPGGTGSGVNVRDQVFEAKAKEVRQQMMTDEQRAFEEAARAQAGAPAMGASDLGATMAKKSDDEWKSDFDKMGERVRMPSRANPMRPIVEEGAAGQSAALDAQGEALQAGADAQHARDVGMADVMDDQQRRLEAAAVDLQAKQFVQAEAAQEEYEALQASAKSVADAVQKFQETPEADPSRYWASLSAGNQAKFAITGMLAGLAGMPSILEQRIQQDIDAQKFNRKQRAAEVGAATAGYNAAHAAYDALLEMHGDERIADEAYRVARMTAMEGEIMATAQRLGVPVNDAKVQEQLGIFAEKKAAAQQQLDTMVAKTPRRLGGGLRSPYTKEQLAMLKDRSKSRLGEASDLRRDVVKHEGTLEVEGIRDKRARDKAAADAELRGKDTRSKNQFEQRKFIATQTSGLRNELAHWGKFRNKYGGRDGDIPGKSWLPLGETLGSHTLTADAREAKAMLERGAMIRLRRESGAGVPAQEKVEDAMSLIAAMSEEDIWRDVENREEEARRMIDFYERAPESSEVEQYLQSVQPNRAPIVSGNVTDPTVVD